MSPRAREVEARKVATAYHTALTAFGVDTIAEAILLWEKVPHDKKGTQAAEWLDEAVQLVMTRRDLASQLGRAYYRLFRALLTGKSVADPFHPDPENVTLADLRHQFKLLLDTVPGADDSEWDNSDRDGDAEVIPIESIPGWKKAHTDDRRRVEQWVAEDLAATGPDVQAKLVAKIDTSQPAKVVDQQRQEAHNKAGARQAAIAEWGIKSGGRDTVVSGIKKDRRAIAWARVSKTGTPCGWCAMLISRGAVYKSKASAEGEGEGDEFHPNCNCEAVPVFALSQYENDPRFDLNREYQSLWPTVTQGLSGKAAVSAWRRFIRTQQADASSKAA